MSKSILMTEITDLVHSLLFSVQLFIFHLITVSAVVLENNTKHGADTGQNNIQGTDTGQNNIQGTDTG